MFKLSVRSWPTLVVWVKNDTPLALVLSLAGFHLFSSLHPCSFSKSPQEQTAPSTSTIKALAQAQSLASVRRIGRED